MDVVIKVAYGLGGFDPGKPDNNVVEVVMGPEEILLGGSGEESP